MNIVGSQNGLKTPKTAKPSATGKNPTVGAGKSPTMQKNGSGSSDVLSFAASKITAPLQDMLSSKLDAVIPEIQAKIVKEKGEANDLDVAEYIASIPMQQTNESLDKMGSAIAKAVLAGFIMVCVTIVATKMIGNAKGH